MKKKWEYLVQDTETSDIVDLNKGCVANCFQYIFFPGHIRW